MCTIPWTLALSSLATHRKFSCLSFFHRLHHTDSPFYKTFICPASYISTRINHDHKIKPIFSRTKKPQYSPLFCQSTSGILCSLALSPTHTNQLSNLFYWHYSKPMNTFSHVIIWSCVNNKQCFFHVLTLYTSAVLIALSFMLYLLMTNWFSCYPTMFALFQQNHCCSWLLYVIPPYVISK